MSETAAALAGPVATTVIPRRSPLAWLSLGYEVIRGGLVELWAHKLRSSLTLTLLMLGVFALVVMTSVLDGVLDKVSTGFEGMAWDGTVRLAPKQPQTSEERNRFAMSPGLRYEDLPRIAADSDQVLGFLPRASRRVPLRLPTGNEYIFVTGLTPDYAQLMARPVAAGRFITPDDERRRSQVAVVGATLGAKLFGGADPVGGDITVEGVRLRIVGLLAPMQIFSEEHYLDANGIAIPLITYMDRFGGGDHKLEHVAVKLRDKEDRAEVSAMLLARAKQAHHGIEDIEIVDLEAEKAKYYENFLEEMRGWRVVLTSLAATVLFVGGVGVLSVMLISFTDRRYEIGLRKAMGASDFEIFVQFLLEALVLAALGALIGTVAGAFLCARLSDLFPWGLVVNKGGLVVAWFTALFLALVFGLYPALRAARLSPVEAMR
jgi:putative ABC transport system permease protein